MFVSQSHQLRGYSGPDGGARHGLSFRRQGGSAVHAHVSHVSAQARAFCVQSRGSPRAIAAGRRNRAGFAPRRIRVRFSRRNIHRATRRAAISPRRVQGGHRRAAARLCPWRLPERAACFATAPGCRAAALSRSRYARRSFRNRTRPTGTKSSACAMPREKSSRASPENLCSDSVLGRQLLRKNSASQVIRGSQLPAVKMIFKSIFPGATGGGAAPESTGAGAPITPALFRSVSLSRKTTVMEVSTSTGSPLSSVGR